MRITIRICPPSYYKLNLLCTARGHTLSRGTSTKGSYGHQLRQMLDRGALAALGKAGQLSLGL